MKSDITSSINASLVTAALATAEQMVFKARMERSAIEFDLRAAYSRIENLQARALGLREQHAKAIDAVNVALERQEALRIVLQPVAPWMFAVPAGDGPRPVDELIQRFSSISTARTESQRGDIEAGAQIPADS